MTEPLPLEYTTASQAAGRPSDPLAFTAAACGVMGLVFLPLGPVGLLLGLVALATWRRRTPIGRKMAVVAVLVGLIATAGLIGVVIWLRHAPAFNGEGVMTAGGKG